MRLLVDVGNTRIKGALEKEGVIKPLTPVAYAESGIEQALNVWSLPDGITGAWVASVGHADICDTLDQIFSQSMGIQAWFPKSTARACGVTNAYLRPDNLGVDRWLSLIAAHARGGPTVVVSAGTAATIDVINATGQHLGGLITPGLSTLRKAMLDHTQVRADTEGKGLELLGNSTDSCVTYGTLQSLVGYINHMLRQLIPEGEHWACLITGGDAQLLLSHLEGSWEPAPNLVLEGLYLLSRETETA